MKPIRRLLVAIFLFGMMAGALEFLLGFLHLERHDPEFTSGTSFPLFLPGEGQFSDDYVTNPHFKAALNFQRFARRKGQGVFRVFVLGGSAAYGWPGEDLDSFTGYLRRALDLSAPGRFEIVNVAGMSYGSHRVLDLLRDVVRYEPDLVVVYSGNNEYVERNVLPSGDRRGGLSYSIRDRMRRLNLYRLLRYAISKTPGLGNLLDRPRGEDITDLRSTPGVPRFPRPRSPEIDETVLRNYRRNLSEMARILGERDIRAVFCSIPVNLDSWQPSEPPLRFTDRDDMLRWVAEVKDGKALLRKDPARAADVFGELIRRKPEWAPGAFYRGKALAAQGKYAAALEMYLVARDRDPRLLRAPGVFNEVVRTVAAGGRGATFLDLETLFLESSPHGITGDALVNDYCHPTAAGHKLIATALAAIVLREAGLEGVRKAVGDAVARDDTPRWKPPLVRASELHAAGRTHSLIGRPVEAEKAFKEVLNLDPGHVGAMNGLGRIYMEKGLLAEARALFLRALAIEPRYVLANYNLGVILFHEGDLEGAEDSMRRILSMNPQVPTAWILLGDIALRKGAAEEALGFYRKALSMGYEGSGLHLMMGKAYLAMGDRGRARQELVKALEFDPADEEAYNLLETAR